MVKVNFFGALIGFLFPGKCRACGALIRDAANPYICPACWGSFRFPEGELCSRCGAKLGTEGGESEVCSTCRAGENLFDRAVWVCDYNDAMRSAIHALKYERRSRIANLLSELMVSRIGEFMEEAKAEALLPVPIHKKKLREREFNQAGLLAKGIGEAYNIPVVEGCLIRDRKTPPQSQLDREGRRSNVRGAFRVTDAKKVREKSVMIVDDIYTTGATVNECSRVLIEAGVKRVYVLTLARPAVH